MLHLAVLHIFFPQSVLRIPRHPQRRVPVQANFFAGKQEVDLLEGEVAGFWVEEVDYWEEAKVEDFIYC
jgi:hypothetical protein